MSFILNWLESLHFEINITDNCSRKRNLHSSCHYCLDGCKKGALSIGEDSLAIDPELCNSCGECVITCPLSAIKGIPTERNFENGSLVYKNSFVPTVKELLIYKNRGMKSIIAGSNLDDQWLAVLHETNQNLLTLGYEQIEVFIKTEEKVSRREFFTSMKQEGRQLAKNAAPASWKIRECEWNLAGYYPDHQFFNVGIDREKCSLCQACVSFCSQKVFDLAEAYLQIDHGRCVNCTDCRDICPEQAIEIKPEITARVVFQEGYVTSQCRTCGKTFKTFHDKAETCHVCEDRDPEWLSPYC